MLHLLSALLFLLILSPACRARDSYEAEKCERDHIRRLDEFSNWADSHPVSVHERHVRLEDMLEDMVACFGNAASKSNEVLQCDFGADDNKLKVSESSIVLVGNGASLLKNHMGSRIDAFEDVLRFNNVKIKGFEAAVGSKTTIVFIGSTFEICPCTEEHHRYGIKSVECCDDDMAAEFWSGFEKRHQIKVISASTRLPAFLLTAPSAPLSVRTMRHVYRFQPWPTGALANAVLSRLATLDPSISTRFRPETVLRNGMYSIMLLLECGIRPTLAGFDVNYSRDAPYVHHYYPLANEPVQAFVGAEKQATVLEHEKGYHDFETEAKVLQELLAAGAVVELKP
eukprot:jgi/Mesvir1/29697/Mv00931-RA.1